MAKKFLLLFTGPTYDEVKKQITTYPEYNPTDITKIIKESSATDLVITTGSRFNYCQSGDRILRKTWIEGDEDKDAAGNKVPQVTDSDFGATGKDLTELWGQMYDAIDAADAIPSSTYNLLKYVDAAVSLAKKLITEANTQGKQIGIWIGFPQLLDNCFAAARAYNYYYRAFVVDKVKEKMGTQWGNITGFYYGQEVITPWYTKFTFSSSQTVKDAGFNNPIVQNMKNLSDYVKSSAMGNKKMLWIPFYQDTVDDWGNDQEISKRLGYVVNLTSIFDYVILQPSYFFKPAVGKSNLDYVYNCVVDKRIENKSRVPYAISTSAYSPALIGAEMEGDNFMTKGTTAENNAYIARYKDYVAKYGSFITSTATGGYITGFYAGDRDSLMNSYVFDRVKAFFAKGLFS